MHSELQLWSKVYVVLIGVFGRVLHLHIWTYVHALCLCTSYNSPKLNAQTQDLLIDCSSWCTYIFGLLLLSCLRLLVYICAYIWYLPYIHLTNVCLCMPMYAYVCLCMPMYAYVCMYHNLPSSHNRIYSACVLQWKPLIMHP